MYMYANVIVANKDSIMNLYNRGFIKGRAPGKLTGCEHNFARLLYISKNFFLIQGAIKNSLSYNRALFLMSLECKTYFAVQCNFHCISLKTRIAL